MTQVLDKKTVKCRKRGKGDYSSTATERNSSNDPKWQSW